MGSSLEGVSSVDIDNEAAAHEMTDHLIGLGHRRIALLSGDANLENTQARERGFKRAMAEAGLEIPAHFLAPGVFTEYSGRDRAQELMILPEAERPTALFCGSDRIAVGALETVHRLGLKVPGEVSIAGFDDVPQALRTEPPLTTIRQPIVDLGKRATEILLGHIDDFTTSSTHVILPAELIVRQSTGSAPEL
jgi:DNA-binding LacI/PurR family transcriptional regulator